MAQVGSGHAAKRSPSCIALQCAGNAYQDGVEQALQARLNPATGLRLRIIIRAAELHVGLRHSLCCSR